ncbi:MAG TPA: ferritin [Vicinamibacterales bacterium]|jgi:ferritin
MNATVQHAINEQINSEFEASYTYLAMSGFCEQQKFMGAAKWLRMQSDEERQHGLKLFDFVLARDGQVELHTIDQPKIAFTSLAAVFEQALAHEKRVTTEINALYELCFGEKAFAEMTELQWFLTEQVEEEKTAREIVAKFNLVKNDPAAILDLDRELGARSVADAGERRR